jgi:hypothetical protein
VPLAGETLNQAESLAAVKLSVPPPVFVTFTLAGAGSAPLCVALRLIPDGKTERFGCCATIKVTAIVNGEPCAPAAVTVTLPVYVPAARLATVAEICNVCGAVPLAGETLNHVESVAAVKLSVPPPVFETLTLCAAGFAPPCTAFMLSVVGETDNTAGGTGCDTIRVTVIVDGEPCAPAAVTVT